MQGFFHIQDSYNQDVQVFTTTLLQQGATYNWSIWEKPRGCSMVFILAIGAGGKGGAGFTRIAGAAGGGGGGGGTGALVKLAIQANMLPDRLFIQVGTGGGIAAGDTIGTVSRISAKDGSVAAQDLVVTTSGTGNAGGAGTGAAVGAGGNNVGSAQSAQILSYGGLWSSVGGVTGGAGGAVAGGNGVSITSLASMILTPGAGGGGTTSADFAGGNITGAGLINTINGGAAGSNNGNAGMQYGSFYPPCNNPLLFTGGSGGGSSNTSVGGKGGDATIGCGGGGGGAGTTGGSGGNGGNGLIIITSM